jgi:hypothetical protein
MRTMGVELAQQMNSAPRVDRLAAGPAVRARLGICKLA